MKICIAHTKEGVNPLFVTECMAKGIITNGDTVLHIKNHDDLSKLQDCDVCISIAFPYLAGTGEVFCQEEWTNPKLAPSNDKTNRFRIAIYQTCKKLGVRQIFIDTGLFNFDRERHSVVDNYYQLSYDSIKGMGNYYNDNSPHDRLKDLNIKIHPWNTQGIHFLIVGQVRFGVGSSHMDINDWYNYVSEYLKRETPKDLELRFRPHPNVKTPPTDRTSPSWIKKCKAGMRPKIVVSNRKPIFEKDFLNVRCLITFSTHACIDGLIFGCPTIAMSKASLLYKYCYRPLSTVMDPVEIPDRKQILADLAYTQWSNFEMADGTAWGHLKQFYNYPQPIH